MLTGIVADVDFGRGKVSWSEGRRLEITALTWDPALSRDCNKYCTSKMRS